jgi:hypothetical protein
MAGTDCGFGTIAGDTQVSEDVVWAKPSRCATARPSRASDCGVEEAAILMKALIEQYPEESNLVVESVLYGR